MELQFHRKKIMFSGIAMLLVIAGYGILEPKTYREKSLFFEKEAESVLLDGSWLPPLIRHDALI